MSSNHRYVGDITKWTHFDYEPLPVCGVGKNKIPIINMDPYIDTSKNDELHIECCLGLSKITDYKTAMFVGATHKDDTAKGKVSFTEILSNLSKYDPTGVHRESIRNIETTSKNPRQDIYKYVYYAMGATIPWFFAYYLRDNNFHTKTKVEAKDWTPAAYEHFPNVVKYIEKLPFKTIGRVLFFTTFPYAGVTTHRDYYVETHNDMNINLFFGSWRPSYVYDDENNKKIYLEDEARSYFFNNRDYHGVDPEPVFRYTLRVDGVFEDWLQKELKLTNGYVYKK